MRIFLTGTLLLLSSAALVFAEVKPVEITVPEASVWKGERLRFTIELRARGSFSGTAYFDLPEIPGVFILKTGNPVVGSEQIEGESWFTQTHQFSLFSQQSGEVVLPSIPVRFDAREGFTGDPKEVSVSTEPITLTFQQPPGTESIPFLISTDSLEIVETWDPEPGEASVGGVFRRTIVQRSRSVPGMALVPAPRLVPEGVRLYEPSVETTDNFERGAFQGERRETLTYLLQEAGTVTLPEMEFAWWNPTADKIERKILAGRTIEVIALPSAIAPAESERKGIMIAACILGIGFVLFFYRRSLAAFWRRVTLAIDPEEARKARALRKACRRSDPDAAEEAWSRWSLSQSEVISESLRQEVTRLQRIRYGPDEESSWDGLALLREFVKERKSRKANTTRTAQKLPELNYPEHSL